MISGRDILKCLASSVSKYSDLDKDFTSISTDSRTCEKDSLFISLEKSSAKADEHALAAITRGSTGVLSQHNLGIKGVSLFVVYDANDAFYQLAGIWRNNFPIPVIAVAGNVGKTTTKEMIAYLLESSGKRILKTEESQNGFQGIPATLIKLRPEHELAVIEVGIDEPHVMSRHARTAKPTNIIITSLGAEHLEKLKEPDIAAQEEFELVLWGTKNGASILLNGDNHYCLDLANRYLNGDNYSFYSLDPSSSERFGKRLRCFGIYEDQKLCVFDLNDNTKFKLSSELPGTHNASNLLGAVSLVLSIGIDSKKIQDITQKFNFASGRSELRTGPKGAKFLCDYYNASPASMTAAFATIAELRKSNSRRRIWLCLGDMLDLGTMEETYHRQLAETLPAEATLFSFGKRMLWTQNQLENTQAQNPRQHFDSLVEMAQALYSSVSPSDSVLIKGSRGMAMERLWHELLRLEAKQVQDEILNFSISN